MVTIWLKLSSPLCESSLLFYIISNLRNLFSLPKEAVKLKLLEETLEQELPQDTGHKARPSDSPRLLRPESQGLCWLPFLLPFSNNFISWDVEGVITSTADHRKDTRSPVHFFLCWWEWEGLERFLAIRIKGFHLDFLSPPVLFMPVSCVFNISHVFRKCTESISKRL